MKTITLIYIIFSLLLSVALSYFLYFFKTKDKQKILILLFALRTFGIFTLLLLLINPTIKKTVLLNKKPPLAILVDNSASMSFFNESENVQKLVNQFKSTKALNDKFDVQFLKFSNRLSVLDTLTFSDSQTDINQALISVDELNKESSSPIVLITDGNQTKGSKYNYHQTKNNIFPIVVGDTTNYADIEIAQLNVNKYTYKDSQFPVETRIVYHGNKPITTQFTIFYKGKSIYKEKCSFTKDRNVKTINSILTAKNNGIHYYKVGIQKIDNEKNTSNNEKTFSVEVLDEKTKILILTSLIHPDLGALKKAIEKNQQREVSIHTIDNFAGSLQAYQLVILYQPTAKFKAVFESLDSLKSNHFIITGTHTDWNFLNKIQTDFTKQYVSQTESYLPLFNNGFLIFNQPNIDYQLLPPLEGTFGKVNFTTKYEALLYQQISDVETTEPLLAFMENQQQKKAVLFGENLWKWRASSFINNKSFENFDGFISNSIQFLASTQKRKRLAVSYDNLYPANKKISITAYYLDKNYQFDERAVLSLKLTNVDTKISQNIPFSLKGKTFESIMPDLKSGNYEFVVTVEGQVLKTFGKFRISTFDIEKQFTNANYTNLAVLAANTFGKTYLPYKSSILIDDLLKDNRYKTIQFSKVKEDTLIHWHFLLILALLFFAIEWFIRKYYGKI